MELGKFLSEFDEISLRLKRRIEAYDWTAISDSRPLAGMPVTASWLRAFCEHWVTRYDWGAFSARIAELNHVFDGIGEECLHGIHFKGTGRRPLLVLIHGWPSSFLEFLELARRLAASGYEVLVPSLPGYAFSAPVHHPIGPRLAAERIAALVRRLGATRFIAHGGDWGAEVSVWLGLIAPDCAGVHLAMRGMAGNEPMSMLRTPQERAWKRRAARRYAAGGLYMEMQTREPMLIGAALADSPVGTAGWISDKFLRWTDAHGRTAQALDGVVDRNFLMDTTTLYCATASVASSLWMYPGYTKDEQTMPCRLEVPTAIFELPNDPVFPWPPRSLLERHYQIRRWTTPPFGAHFAALETPDHLFADLVAFADEIDGNRLGI